MRSHSQANIKASIRGRNGHQVWAFTPFVSRAFAALRSSHVVPDHIFLIIAGPDQNIYGIARLSSKPSESEYGGLEFWPDQFEHAGNGNFEVQWIHQCLEPFSSFIHDPPLSTLPNGSELMQHGFAIGNLLLKRPKVPHAQRTLIAPVRPYPSAGESSGHDSSHAEPTGPLLSEFVDVALQDQQASGVMTEQCARIQPEEAAQIAGGIAASWGEVAGLSAGPAQGIEESTEIDMQERIYVITFTRNPIEFETCLHEGDELESLRFFTRSKGYSCRLREGGSIFVHPEQHTQVRSQITARRLEFGPSHVVVSETYKHLVYLAVSNLRSRLNVRAKDEAQLTNMPIREDVLVAATSAKDVLLVKRTFLCLCPRAMRMSASVVQSTGDAHTSVHPRRWRVASDSVPGEVDG